MQVVFKGSSAVGEGPLRPGARRPPGRRPAARGGARKRARSTAEDTFGGGWKAPGGKRSGDVDVGPQRIEHGEDPVLLRARAARRRAARPPPAASRAASRHAAAQVEEPAQQRARDVVGQVADQPRRRRRRARARSTVSASPCDDGQVARARAARRRVGQAAVELDRDDAPRARRQRQGQRAGAGTDLEERLVRPRIDDAQQPLDRRGRGGSAGRAGGPCASLTEVPVQTSPSSSPLFLRACRPS